MRWSPPGLAIATGSDAASTFAALEHLTGAKGRLERVGTNHGAPIFVDYAHKPDALAKALEALRPYVTGKLVAVFGAGGDRDRGKRPLMGAIATEKADRVIVTDDNPRNENPAAIRAAILGAANGAIEIGDRREAIHHAIADLRPGDVLLIAGKGHETGQIIGDRVIEFSDHEAVARLSRNSQHGLRPRCGPLTRWRSKRCAPSGGALPETVWAVDRQPLPAPGEAFFAITGDSRDGHDFVAQALAAKAGLAVVAADRRRQFPADAPLLVVPDVPAALRDLAVAARARIQAKVIGVTGSVEDQTRKHCGWRWRKTVRPTPVRLLNNHGACPSLARCPPARVMPFRNGHNHEGEIEPLSPAGRPHVAIITGSRQCIWRKSRLADQDRRCQGGKLFRHRAGGAVLYNLGISRKNNLKPPAPRGGGRRLHMFRLASQRAAHAVASGRAASRPARPSRQKSSASISGVNKIGAPGRHLVIRSAPVPGCWPNWSVPILGLAGSWRSPNPIRCPARWAPIAIEPPWRPRTPPP